MHVKKGDTVKVISGKDKGKTGVIARALPREGKVVIDGVAIAKRHTKKIGNQSGRIIERPMPIDASNVTKI
ncbi:MAG: 50S ribosomal protein L24 [bacterium]|nr:50S ribosomal protein L24 [bacterium]